MRHLWLIFKHCDPSVRQLAIQHLLSQKPFPVNPSLFIVFSFPKMDFDPFWWHLSFHEIWRFGWVNLLSSFFFVNFIIIFQSLLQKSFRKKIKNVVPHFLGHFVDCLRRTQTTKVALKNALYFTSHSLKLASSKEKTSKSKVCGTQQQDACYSFTL